MADTEQPAVNGEVSQESSDKAGSTLSTIVIHQESQTSEMASPGAEAPSSTPVGDAPPTLSEDELEVLRSAASGSTDLPDWETNLRPLVLKQLTANIHRFTADPPPPPPPRSEIPTTTFGVVFKSFPERGPPSPRSTTVRLPVVLSGDELKREEEKIRSMLDEFDEGPPFTIQRLAELLLNPYKEYRMVGKYLRAVQRVLAVTPSFDPGVYAPAPAESSSNGLSSSSTATPFQLATTPMFSPIPFLQGRELPTPPPRRSASPPMSPLDIGPRRSPTSSPRGSPRIAGRRGGPRVATSSAAMSAQTRRRANSQSSPTSPNSLGSRPSVPDAFPLAPATGSSSQGRSPTPPPTSPPTGPTPTRVDELDNPDAHKTLLDEPVALSSVTTGKVKVKSPEIRPAEVAGILGVVSSSNGETAKSQPVAGLGLSLGERFVPASSAAPPTEKKSREGEEKNEEEKNEEEKGSNGSGEGEGEEGEVERMVSEEREMEDAADDAEPAKEAEKKPAGEAEDVTMSE